MTADTLKKVNKILFCACCVCVLCLFPSAANNDAFSEKLCRLYERAKKTQTPHGQNPPNDKCIA